ncbi:hypothetical protein HK405_012138 [Cladochytrium tenue]|nr:hypothetical protein HK405_012138 [Cladochytrium tenue]
MQEFRGDRWVDDEFKCGGWIYISQSCEDLRIAAEAEEKFQWRRLMARVWREIAANTKIRSLEIVTPPPNITTAWADAAWPTFVDNLERLTIRLWAVDNGAGWQSNTTPGNLQFLEKHLPHLTTRGACSTLRLLLTKSTLSAVRSITTGRIRLSEIRTCRNYTALLEFLRSHADVLETLHLVKCMATTFNISTL